MDPKELGEQRAFPSTNTYGVGLTKREYFAGLAMQGIQARYQHTSGDCARMAVEHADALLAELAKGE